jgi:hypothetical protein
MNEIEAITEVADIIGGKVLKSYSGRGMFSKTCYGIVCEDPVVCIEEAVVLGLKGACKDNMGLKSIVYWPKVKGEVFNA